MADSIIGALRVVLGLDTAAFSSGAKEAQSTLDGLSKSFKTAIAGLGHWCIGYPICKINPWVGGRLSRRVGQGITKIWRARRTIIRIEICRRIG